MTAKRLLVVGVMLAVALIGRPATATPLLPGTTVMPSPFAGSPGTLLAVVTDPFTSSLGATDFSGTVTERVYKDSVTGFLDFVYQFHNNAASLQPIEQMSDSIFGGFTTDVQVDTTVGFDGFTPGGVSPLTANRSAIPGNNVAWQFAGNDVAAGATSAILMIKTNATAFGPGNISFINTGTATLTNVFGPAGTPTVPDSGSTLGLLAVALAALVGASWLRSIRLA